MSDIDFDPLVPAAEDPLLRDRLIAARREAAAIRPTLKEDPDGRDSARQTDGSEDHRAAGNLPCGREPEATVTTYPTRTVTNTYPAGFQSQRGDQVRRGDGET